MIIALLGVSFSRYKKHHALSLCDRLQLQQELGGHTVWYTRYLYNIIEGKPLLVSCTISRIWMAGMDTSMLSPRTCLLMACVCTKSKEILTNVQWHTGKTIFGVTPSCCCWNPELPVKNTNDSYLQNSKHTTMFLSSEYCCLP